MCPRLCMCVCVCEWVSVWVCIRSAAVPHPGLRADCVCEGFPASHRVTVARHAASGAAFKIRVPFKIKLGSRLRARN